jgi:hypothetical protein
MWEIPKSSDAVLSEVDLIHLHTPWTWVLSNNIPVVIPDGKLAHLDNARRVKDRICGYLAVYW